VYLLLLKSLLSEIRHPDFLQELQAPLEGDMTSLLAAAITLQSA
jgi:hypothetical protein